MEATREASDGSRERRRRRRLRVASPEASAGEACSTAAAALGALLRAGLASFSTNRLSDQLLDEARKDGYIRGGGVEVLRFLAILGSAAQVRIGTLDCKFDPGCKFDFLPSSPIYHSRTVHAAPKRCGSELEL